MATFIHSTQSQTTKMKCLSKINVSSFIFFVFACKMKNFATAFFVFFFFTFSFSLLFLGRVVKVILCIIHHLILRAHVARTRLLSLDTLANALEKQLIVELSKNVESCSSTT